MQYYNRFLKKSGRSSDDNRVVCLNQVVTSCAEKAGAAYPCKLNFDCCKELLYSSEDCDELIARTCDAFDFYCLSNAEIFASLNRISRSAASLAFKDGSGNLLTEVTYDLYTGTPSSVISDPESDRELMSKIDEIYGVLKKLKDKNAPQNKK